jgi:hypothetical protein
MRFSISCRSGSQQPRPGRNWRRLPSYAVAESVKHRTRESQCAGSNRTDDRLFFPMSELSFSLVSTDRLAHCVTSRQVVKFQSAFRHCPAEIQCQSIDREAVRRCSICAFAGWVARCPHRTAVQTRTFIRDQESLRTTTPYTETILPARGVTPASYEHETPYT